jgi:glycosyltransferase involved in cell wall biosynthesis
MMEKTAKVTVIVPVYNVEKYLRKCLNSLINQTYKNLEIIVINDGSTDNSADICDEFAVKDSRVLVIHQKNSGVSVARNVGLDKMTGSYVTFVDSDDYLELNAVERYIEIMTEYEADVVLCEGITFFEKTKKYIPYKNFENCSTDYLKEKLLLDQIGNQIATNFYIAKIWNGIRFPEKLVYEDFYIMPDICMKAKKIVYKCEPLYWYNRMNASSQTSLWNDFNAWHRYSKFKGYCEHLRIAKLLNKPNIMEWAEKKALHEIVKAFCRNYGKPCLSDNDLKEMKAYLKNNIKRIKQLKIKDRFLIWSILNCPYICKMYGKILHIIFKFKMSKNFN